MQTRLALALSFWAGFPGFLGACGGGEDAVVDASPVIDARQPAGTMSLAWSIVSDSQTPLDCTDVAGKTVVLEATPEGGVVAEVDSFVCSSGMGTSRGFPPGTYDVRIKLRTTGGAELAAPILRQDVVVTDQGDVSLGTVQFVVAPWGTLRFRLDAEGAGTNCGGPPAGAGVTGFSLTLEQDDACVPFDLYVGGASAPEALTCPADEIACVEPDVQLRTGTLASGPTTLMIRGLVGGVGCFQHAAPTEVPGGGLANDLGTIAVPSSGDQDAGCP